MAVAKEQIRPIFMIDRDLRYIYLDSSSVVSYNPFIETCGTFFGGVLYGKTGLYVYLCR